MVTAVWSIVSRSDTTDQLARLLDDIGPVLFYLAVWGLIFAGTALYLGVVLPFLTGDSLLFGAGLIAGSTDQLSVAVLAVGAAAAAVAGDQVGYALGRRHGRPRLQRSGRNWVRRALDRTDRFYALFGWWSVVLARYVPWARVFIPTIAGASGMTLLRFTTANLAGALGWAAMITTLGGWAASEPAVRPLAYVIGAAVVLASVIAGVRAWRKDRRASAPIPAQPEGALR